MNHISPTGSDPERGLGGVIAILAGAAFISGMSMRVADPMLPQLAREFATDLGDAARTVSWYAIAYGLMQLALGALGDRFGRLRVVAVAACVSSVGSVACALTGSLDQLVVARLGTAAAAAGIIPTSLAWLGDQVPYERRQVTLARLAIGTTLGLACGQVLGGVLVDTLGWRWAFALLALGFCSAGALLLYIGRQYPQRPAAASAGFFARIGTVLRMPWARRLYLVSALEAATAFAVMALTPSYLHQELALPLAAAGSAVATIGVGALCYTLAAHRLVPRLGEVRLAAGGGLLFALTLGLLVLSTSGWLVALLCLVMGFGFYMVHNTLQANMTQISVEARGTAVALFATLIFFGQAGGVSLGAWLMGVVGPRPVLLGCALVFGAVGLLLGADLRRRRAASAP